MKNKFRMVAWIMAILGIVGAGVAVGVYLVHPKDRVSLDVRNMDVHELAHLLERQSGRTIVVQSNVAGKVTLKAKGIMLEKALAIIAEQTSSRASSIYPLYVDRKGFRSFEAALSGMEPSAPGWTNLRANVGGARFPGRGGRDMGTNRSVSLKLSFEELAFAALAFSGLTPAHIVVQDPATNRVSLTLNNVPIDKAVAMLAGKAGRKWTHVYVLSSGGPGRGPGPEGRPLRAPTAKSDDELAERDVLNQHLLDTLPDEERAKREQAALDREKQIEAFKNMTGEERRQAMQANGSAGGSQRALERIKNSTPEQRAAGHNRMASGPGSAKRPTL